MRRFLTLLSAVLITACSDGDLQIETIDFDDTPVQFCDSQTTTDSNFFFKISGDQALILVLQDGVLANEVSDGTIVSTVPGQSRLIYRIFSDDVSKSYFCDELPPAEPSVLEEVEAAAGEILVTTLQSESDSTVFEHNIVLSNISLVNDKGERITDLRINNFGTITTSE
ncbi:hypothetical protein [Zeaxanthinibacter enoshimensis]|uniref:hypothetical protein n=1 Tax=Zeaxanthinibacter enoshimensis TaxID=392009 RepID=UPI00356ADE93